MQTDRQTDILTFGNHTLEAYLKPCSHCQCLHKFRKQMMRVSEEREDMRYLRTKGRN
jgi:hypothetical protein